MPKQEQLSLIKMADSAYYNSDTPIMSDEEYDALRNDYISKYGSKDLDYIAGDATTSRKFKHPIEVTSLAKVDDSNEAKFLSEIERLSPVVIEPKYDGLTVVAYPREDGSYFFVTRGSGREGDILPNFLDVYEDAKGKNTKFAIRGEAYMTIANFNKMNDELEKAGEPKKANPRNAVAGILNPTRIEKSRFINLLDYDCYDVIGLDVPEDKKLDYINDNTPFVATESMGFGDNCSGQEIMNNIREWHKEIIDNEIYPVDGMVIKTNQDNSLKKFGSTDHHPKNAVAIKANQTATFTTLRGMEWQVGKTGALTPVAVFDPIEILGSTVSKASVSNPDEIKRLDLRIGDTIGVIKAKEIIPKIVLNNGGGDKDIETPTKCPACGGPLKKNGPIIYCDNDACDEKVAQKIAFMASKNVLDVSGLSIQTARKIVAAMKNTFQYKNMTEKQNIWLGLSRDDLLALDGFSDKSADNLYDRINDLLLSKDVSLPRFIKACCVDGIGENVGKILENKFNGIQKMFDVFSWQMITYYGVNKDEVYNMLSSIDGIGKETANILISKRFWFAVPELFKYIQPVVQQKNTNTESNVNIDVQNKVFVLTGKMPKKRSEYEKLIASEGGIIGGSVTSKTNYLVIADINSTSAKAEKARKLGVKMISPDDLCNMLKQ